MNTALAPRYAPVILRRTDGTEGMLLTDLRPLPDLQDLDESECSAGPGFSYVEASQRYQIAPPRVPKAARMNTGPAAGLGLVIVGFIGCVCLAVWAWRTFL